MANFFRMSNLYLMKQGLSLVFVFFSGVTLAQAPADPANASLTLGPIDTLTQRITRARADVVTSSRLDSIRNEFNIAAESFHVEYRDAVADVNSETRTINQTIDSLNRLKLPFNKQKRRLKKLARIRQNAEAEFSEKLNALKSKTTEKLNALDLPPYYKEPLQKLRQQINSVTIDKHAIKLPELNIPGYDTPGLKTIGNAPLLETLTSQTDIPQLPNMQPPSEVSDATQQIQGYKGDLDKIANTDITNAERLEKTVESQAARIDGIDELQKQSDVIDAHQSKLEELADPDKGKKKAVELAKKAAVDHFAGKEEQLKAAMEKISKYKQKFPSASSIKDLPKRPPNPMKEKPFVERLTPGLYFQYQQKNFYLVDVNPYIGYKISGRFAAGLGWNHRLAYDKKHRNFDHRSRIFGPRGYLDFKLGKGFIAHLEGERMNAFVPSTLLGNPDTGQREWVWSFMTGLKKEYKIHKNLRGTALIQYNWFNKYYKAPYVDRLNSRVGFEYVLIKKPREK